MTYILKQIKALTHLFPFLWPKSWSIRLRFLSGLFLLFTTIVLNVGVPLYLRHVINVISNQSSTLLLAETVLIFYGVLWFLSKLSEQLRLLIMAKVIWHGITLLCLKTFDHLLSLSMRFHSDRKTGVIINAMDRAQYAFPNLIWGIFFTIFPTLVEIVIAACILTFLYGSIFGIILTAVLIIYMIVSIIGSAWSVAALTKANLMYEQVSHKLIDSLLNYETVRYFSNDQFEHERCMTLLLNREEAISKQHAKGEIVHIAQALIMGIGLIILTWLSGIKVLNGQLQISDFVLINAYLLQFMIPLGQFGYVFRSINEALTNINSILGILEEKPEVVERTQAKPLVIRQGKIVFDNVKFEYDNRRPILCGISFEVPAKKTVAIVGPTGSGKSTISKLLFRLYDITSGNIFIDDQDIRSVTLSSLQQSIAIVPQHTALFNESLRYNITYGNPNATESDLQQAIHNAYLTAFIDTLPDGLNTVVGEQGLKLSGGERQRVAIARVLLKSPSILIFDEATSSLDTKTEQIIQLNLEEISKNATTIVIAHRLSTITHADHIIVLNHGVIAEEGTHEELIQNKGLYAMLWEKQIASKNQ